MLSKQGANQFCDLHRIGSGTFAQVIGDNPQIKRVGLAFVAANATNKNVVFAFGKARHWVFVSSRVVLKCDSRGMRKERANLL